MALVTVQRSPSVSSCSSPPSSDSGAGNSVDEDDAAKNSRSLSECYFAGKGAALVLPPNERVGPSRRVSASGSDIQQHLQSMFYLLRPEETLKMAVKLESVHAGRTRYLVVVSCVGRQDAEESCLLGIDCNEKTTVGLVLRVLADTAITLDGDGGFSVSVCGRQHIFKPVSVQAMWSALQTLHKVSWKAREQNYFLGGLTHDWVGYYEQRIESDRSCLNEWHAMDSLESRRPPSPDSVRTKPREREETERVIRCTLKEIMMSVDLDEVTSKYIRGRLEEDLDMDLGEFKPFIDQEMLTILGQMDAATEIFDHVYLGSEWNASNLEELQKNGVRHILNVTREIDNFFPGMFNYLNVRVYDDERTDLLKHWDNTFKYITSAKKEGSKVLVHCKMGVSRSASVVIAYAMKAYNWDFKRALDHVKKKRTCIKPNTSFVSQLETYQGILDAMKNREKLQRSKSETNLKSPGLVAKAEQRGGSHKGLTREPSPEVRPSPGLLEAGWLLSGRELGKAGSRPKSWSPDNTTTFASSAIGPTSVSLEHLNLDGSLAEKQVDVEPTLEGQMTPTGPPSTPPPTPPADTADPRYNLNVRMPCGNGQAYSVSQNKVVFLPRSYEDESSEVSLVSVSCCCDPVIASVKHRVSELESQVGRGKGLVLNLAPELPPPMLTAVLVKKEIWDPGEKGSPTNVWTADKQDLVFVSELKLADTNDAETVASSDDQMVQHNKTVVPNGEIMVQSDVTVVVQNGETVTPSCEEVVQSGDQVCQVPVRTRREGDPFSTQLDRVFEREERKQQRVVVPTPPPCVVEPVTEVTRECPSRQSSWSSYDSAVVLGEGRDSPSRQSSWGSGDTRYMGTLPSRNSSWGSYDMRPPMQYVNERGERDESWFPGTVKRTKQKLEESTVKRVCAECVAPPTPAINVKVHGPRPYRSPSSDRRPVEACNPLVHYASSPTLCCHRDPSVISKDMPLSRSAPTSSCISLVLGLTTPSSSPCIISTTQCASVKQQRRVLENLTNTRCQSEPESTTLDKTTAGLVKNLKKEFEAKLGGDGKGRSLPTSPVSGQPSPTEDLSVKVLVGRYDNRNRHSTLLAHNLRNGGDESRVVVAGVVRAASKKQQQGKTHPLARLTVARPRHNNPVYNTM